MTHLLRLTFGLIGVAIAVAIATIIELFQVNFALVLLTVWILLGLYAIGYIIEKRLFK